MNHQTTLVAVFVTSPDRDAAIRAWERHLADDGVSSTVGDAALFDVLDGEGDYLLWHEVSESSHADSIESSVRQHFGEDSVVDATRFARTFAADDARPLSEAARYVFLPRITVDEALDHAAFNEWYDGTHIPDVARVGLHKAQRYQAMENGNDYLASYEIESPAVLRSPEIAAIRGFHHFTPSVLHLGRTTAELLARRTA
jgi:hypothetical protein